MWERNDAIIKRTSTSRETIPLNDKFIPQSRLKIFLKPVAFLNGLRFKIFIYQVIINGDKAQTMLIFDEKYAKIFLILLMSVFTCIAVLMPYNGNCIFV
jgi:hypothetical protein